MELSATVLRSDETLVVSYSTGDVDFPRIDVDAGWLGAPIEVFGSSNTITTRLDDRRLQEDSAGQESFSIAELLGERDYGTFRVALVGSQPGQNSQILAEEWVLAYHAPATHPDAIGFDAEEIEFGQSVEVAVRGSGSFISADGYSRSYEEAEAYLVQLGRVLPGGAVLLDSHYPTSLRAGETFGVGHHRADPYPDLPYRLPGWYELRLVDLRHNMISSTAPFAVRWPIAERGLSLVPPAENAYDFDDKPSIVVDGVAPGGALLEVSQGEVRVLRADNGEVWHEVADAPVEGWLRPEDGRPDLQGFLQYETLPPGRYAVHLVTDLDLTPTSLATVGLTIGGDFPDDWLPQRTEPALAWGDVALALDKPAYRVGEQVAATVAAPDGIVLDERGAVAEVWRRQHFAYDCAVVLAEKVGEYENNPFSVGANGSIAFPAPPQAGAYELRIYEPTLDRGQALLARQPFDVEFPALDGAIAVELPQRIEAGTELTVRVDLPEDWPFEHHRLELWRSAEVLAGGVTRIAEPIRRFHYEEFEIEFDGPTLRTTLPPLWPMGFYELRLTVNGGSYVGGNFTSDDTYLDRWLFEVVDQRAPAWPADARPLRARSDDWPTPYDPLRNAEIAAPPDYLCEDPWFETPPELLVVELYGHDVADPDDNEYRPVERVVAGHPVFIEAHFEEAPPDDIYRVDIGDGDHALVRRTEDPRLYRSEALVLVAEDGS